MCGSELTEARFRGGTRKYIMITEIAVLVALLAFLAYGLYRGTGIRLYEYVANRDRTSGRGVFFSILGTCLGGWMFFGVTAIGYEAGAVGYVVGLAYAVGLVMMGLMAPAAKRIAHENKCDIVDDVVALKYGDHARYLIGIMNLVILLAFVASQIVAFQSLLSVVGGRWAIATVVFGVFVVVCYTALAGYRGVLGTDVVQFVLLAVGSMALLAFVVGKVGISKLSEAPSEYFTGYGPPELGYGRMFVIGAFAFFAPSLLVRTDLWQRIASAKDAKAARRALIAAAPVMLCGYTIFTTIGIYARAILGPKLAGRETAKAGMLLFRYLLSARGDEIGAGGEVLVALVTLAVFAAILSTADSFLNLLATTISKVYHKDLWRKYDSEQEVAQPQRTSRAARWLRRKIGRDETIERTPSERALLVRLRILTVVGAALAIGLAICVRSIVDLVIASASALMIFAPAILIGTFTESPNKGAGLTSMIAGLGVYANFIVLGLATKGVYNKAAFVPGVFAAILGYVVGAVVFKGPRAPDKMQRDQGHSSGADNAEGLG